VIEEACKFLDFPNAFDEMADKAKEREERVEMLV